MSEEIDRLNSVLEKKNKEIGELNLRLNEAQEMSVTISTLQQKVAGLVNENKTLDSEMRTAQENLRLSTNQNQRIMMELNEYRGRIQANEE